MKPKIAALLLVFFAMIFGISWAPVSSAASPSGWIRFGNLSHQVGAVDVYTRPSSSGATAQKLVASDLTYGTVLNAVAVPTGTYTVDLRTAGTSASSPKLASFSVKVRASTLYLVAPLEVAGQGSERHIDLKALPDATNSTTGDAYVQAINASSKHGSVTFHCSCAQGAPGNILTSASAGTAMTAKIPPGKWTMTASGADAKSSVYVPLAANTDRTEIILDGSDGLEILNLLDTVGGTVPTGSVGAGLGGTAPHGPGSPLPWVALTSAGALLAVGGSLWLSRGRPRRPAASQPGRPAAKV